MDLPCGAGVTLRVSATVPGRDRLFAGLESDFARIATDAMRGATKTLQATLRDQVRAAGMGGRLANTWRSETYPDAQNALNPTGYAWSNAPEIIDAFARGATIAPLGGKHYLWIPTRRVPRRPGQGRASSTKRMSPDQLLASLGLERFVIRKGKGSHLLAFVPEKRGRTARGRVRAARRGRIAHGADEQLILMFTLTPTVKLPRKFDLQDAADHAATDFVTRFEQGAR